MLGMKARLLLVVGVLAAAAGAAGCAFDSGGDTTEEPARDYVTVAPQAKCPDCLHLSHNPSDPNREQRDGGGIIEQDAAQALGLNCGELCLDPVSNTCVDACPGGAACADDGTCHEHSIAQP